MSWLYKNRPFTSQMIQSYVGFVYLIECIGTGRKYIGKKNFWAKHTKPPLKGKVRKRRSLKESDWQKYWGSNDEVKLDILRHGADQFTRTILHLCGTKGMMSYLEMKEQITRDVLLKPNEYYNSFVGGKIHRIHVRRTKQRVRL